MTFKVFISSSVRDEKIVEGLREAFNRYGITSVLSNDTSIGTTNEQYLRQQICSCDCFLAIFGRGGMTPACVNFQLGIAVSMNKTVVPIVEEGAEIPPHLASRTYILIDSNYPRASYERAAMYLSNLKINKEKSDAIGGIVLLGLGLLLLGALAASD